MIEDYDDGGILIIDGAHQLFSPQVGLIGRIALDIRLNMAETNVGKLAVIFWCIRGRWKPSSSIIRASAAGFQIWWILTTLRVMNSGRYCLKPYRLIPRKDGCRRGAWTDYICAASSVVYLPHAVRTALATHARRKKSLSLITQRQARRLVKEKRDGQEHSCRSLTKDDLLGPNPSAAIDTSQACHDT